jgi:hypothetical protein
MIIGTMTTTAEFQTLNQMITYLKKKMRSNQITFKPTISYLHLRIRQGQAGLCKNQHFISILVEADGLDRTFMLIKLNFN